MSDAHIQSLYDALFKSVEGRTHKMSVREKLGNYYKYFKYMAGWMLSEEDRRYNNIKSKYKKLCEACNHVKSD